MSSSSPERVSLFIQFLTISERVGSGSVLIIDNACETRCGASHLVLVISTFPLDFSLEFRLYDGNPAHTDTQTAPGYLSSLQFRDERVPDTLIQSLGAPTPGGILTGPPPNPYVTTLLPSPQSAIIPARSTVPPNPLIQATIVDGTNAVNPAMVTLTLDAQSVLATVNKMGDTTTVSPPSTSAGT